MPADEMTTAKRLREMRAYINTHPDLSRYCQLLEQAAIELESLNGPEGEAASQLERELAAAKYNESVFRALHLDSEKRLETSITPSHVGDSGDWWSQFDDAYAKAGKTGDPLDWMNAAVAAANARRFTPSPVEPREPVWLIERGQAEGQSPTIWHTGEEQPRTMQAYLGQWTEEAHRAAKFPTKGQAEHWAETMGRLINYRVTEHIFLDRPTLTPSSNGEGTTYVPGLWRCAKCKLDLIHTNLHVYSGTTSPNNDPQPCPNGCGPMWRVSEADYRKELLAQVGKLFDEVQSLRSSSGSRSFPICKDHEGADWNQPALDDDACVLCRLFYLEAQECLLEEWQQRADRAEGTIAEIKRPLDEQMARLNATVTQLNADKERLERELAEARANADDWMRLYGSTQGHSASLAPPQRRPLRQVIGEPVAWRYRLHGTTNGVAWSFTDEKPTSAREAEPLYLAPPSSGSSDIDAIIAHALDESLEPRNRLQGVIARLEQMRPEITDGMVDRALEALKEAMRARCPGNGDDGDPVLCQSFEASEQSRPCPPGCCVMAEEKDVRSVIEAIEREEGSVTESASGALSEPERIAQKWLAATPLATMKVNMAGALLRDALHPTSAAEVPASLTRESQ